MSAPSPISYTDTAGVHWHKSSYSGGSNGCVEHGSLGLAVEAVRDTKDPARISKVTVSSSAWSAFVSAAKSGVL